MESQITNITTPEEEAEYCEYYGIEIDPDYVVDNIVSDNIEDEAQYCSYYKI